MFKIVVVILLNFGMSRFCLAAKESDKIDPLNAGIDRVYADLANDRVFNSRTCPEYINSVTDFMFKQPADYFIPKTLDQTAEFKKMAII